MAKRKSIDGLGYDLDEFTDFFDSETVKRIKLEQGTVAAPSLCFDPDGTTGLYSTGVGNISIAASTTNSIDIDSSGTEVAGSLKVNYNGGANTSQLLIGRTGGNSLGIYTEDRSALTPGASAGGVGTANESMITTLSGGGNIHIEPIGDLIVHRGPTDTTPCVLIYGNNGAGSHAESIRLISGTNSGSIEVNSPNDPANPGYAFVGDSDSGMYHIAANQIGFATGSGKRLSISSTEVESSVPINFISGQGVSFDDSGSDVLGWYETGTHTTDWSGAFDVPITGAVNYTRIGNVVTLNLPADVIQVGGSVNLDFIYMDTTLPSSLWPSTDLGFHIRVLNGGANDLGILTIDTAGDITITRRLQGSTFDTVDLGFRTFNITYIV